MGKTHLEFEIILAKADDGSHQLSSTLNVPLPLTGPTDDRFICTCSNPTASRKDWSKYAEQTREGETKLNVSCIVKGDKEDALKVKVGAGSQLFFPDIVLPSFLSEDEDDFEEQVVKLAVDGPEFKAVVMRNENAKCTCTIKKGSVAPFVATYMPFTQPDYKTA